MPSALLTRSTVSPLRAPRRRGTSAAYEDYLAQRRPPEPGGTEWRERKFANLARVELADIYIRLGEYDKAAAHAEQALLEEEYPQIVTMAENCLRRIFEAQSQAQPEG